MIRHLLCALGAHAWLPVGDGWAACTGCDRRTYTGTRRAA